MITDADQYTVSRKLAGVVVLQKKVQLTAVTEGFLMMLSVRASWVMLHTNPIIYFREALLKKKAVIAMSLCIITFQEFLMFLKLKFCSTNAFHCACKCTVLLKDAVVMICGNLKLSYPLLYLLACNVLCFLID